MVSSFNQTYDAHHHHHHHHHCVHILNIMLLMTMTKNSVQLEAIYSFTGLEIIMPVNCLSEGHTGHHCRALLTPP